MGSHIYLPVAKAEAGLQLLIAILEQLNLVENVVETAVSQSGMVGSRTAPTIEGLAVNPLVIKSEFWLCGG